MSQAEGRQLPQAAQQIRMAADLMDDTPLAGVRKAQAFTPKDATVDADRPAAKAFKARSTDNTDRKSGRKGPEVGWTTPKGDIEGQNTILPP